MIIALRVKPRGEELRATIDKTRKRLVYAVERKELTVAGSPPSQLYFVPEVLAWAKLKWPVAFADIRVKSEVNGKSSLHLEDALHVNYYPADLEQCTNLLREAYQTVERLEGELAKVHEELGRLRPLAEKYEQNREKNRKSAKLPRKDPR